MSQISIQSNAIANGMIKQIISNFQTQLLAKEVVKKLPEKLEQNMRQLTSEILYTKHLPKPYNKRQPPIVQDIMLIHPDKQPYLISNVPVISKQNLSRLQLQSALKSNRTSKTARHLSSQQLRTTRKNVKINLDNLNANKVIQLRPQQSTAKSFRSAIQLQSRITQLRKTFLKQIKEKEKLNETSKQYFVSKRKKIPKQFTYDYDFSMLESSLQRKKGTLQSPLKTKSISTGQIIKKVKNPEIPADVDSNLQEQLARKSTALPQKEKRVYNNSSKRQVSHFPYISLAENSILYQNDNILHGHGSVCKSQTCQSWRRKSSFTPFFENVKVDNLSIDLITENEDVVFPATIRKELSKSLHENGSIMKNSRFFKKSVKNEEKQSRYIEFNPINVTRNQVIDQFYKIKAIDK